MTKLNLGCGIYYKPGYINIDQTNSAVCDLKADITQLPHENNSMGEIEASHIIEHFPNEVIPFILAEWYRVLKPSGKLTIETPHIFRLVKKLVKTRNKNKNSVLRFLFGTDSLDPSNLHKTGYTPNHLKSILASIGFQKIQQSEQRSFKDLPGFRIVSIKSKSTRNNVNTRFLTTFRWKLLKAFPLQKWDMDFYAAVDKNCIRVIDSLLQTNTQNFESFTAEKIIKTCAVFTLFHPKVAKNFIALFEQQIRKRINQTVLDYFEEHKLPQYLVANWVNWKKEPYQQTRSVLHFYKHWTKRISLYLQKKDIDLDELDTDFSYLFSSKPSSIQYFDFDQVSYLAQKVFYQGIRAFDKRKILKAERLFNQAIKMNPRYGLAYWNLARVLQAKSNYNKNRVWYYYKLAKDMLGLDDKKDILDQEMVEFKNNSERTSKNVSFPINFRY